MSKASQEQAGGNSSTNVQAGRDLHFHGLTFSEAREVALDVFKANALELRGIAQSVALNRAEEITNDFLDKLSETSPINSESLADPDMQNVLFEAQKGYARSGEEDLKHALIGLLEERAGQNDRDLRTLALNEAIASAPKLTEKQRRAIAWVFYLRYTRDVGSHNLDSYFLGFEEVLNGLGTSVPDRHADYQHIEYVGAGSISLSSLPIGKAMRSGSEALFTKGFPESTLDGELLMKLRGANLLLTCLRDSENVQINHLTAQTLPDRLKEAGLEGDLEAILALMGNGEMPDADVADEAVNRFPALEPLKTVWESENLGLKNLTLTSVGIALGHTYWMRLTGSQAPLSIWL